MTSSSAELCALRDSFEFIAETAEFRRGFELRQDHATSPKGFVKPLLPSGEIVVSSSHAHHAVTQTPPPMAAMGDGCLVRRQHRSRGHGLVGME